MSWDLKVPYRGLDQPLWEIDSAELAALDVGERPIARHIIAELAFERGLETAEQALAHLEALDGAGRRALLDAARAGEGWPLTAAVDEAERQRSAPTVPVRTVAGEQVDSQGRLLQTCGEPGCPAYPTDASGALIGSNALRWYCEAHRVGHEEELVPREPGRVIAGPGGGFQFEAELQAQAERGKVQAALMGEELERRRREAEAGWETTRKARERYEAATAADNFVNPPIAGIDRSRIVR